MGPIKNLLVLIVYCVGNILQHGIFVSTGVCDQDLAFALYLYKTLRKSGNVHLDVKVAFTFELMNSYVEFRIPPTQSFAVRCCEDRYTHSIWVNCPEDSARILYCFHHKDSIKYMEKFKTYRDEITKLFPEKNCAIRFDEYGQNQSIDNYNKRIERIRILSDASRIMQSKSLTSRLPYKKPVLHKHSAALPRIEGSVKGIFRSGGREPEVSSRRTTFANIADQSRRGTPQQRSYPFGVKLTYSSLGQTRIPQALPKQSRGLSEMFQTVKDPEKFRKSIGEISGSLNPNQEADLNDILGLITEEMPALSRSSRIEEQDVTYSRQPQISQLGTTQSKEMEDLLNLNP